MRNCLGINYLVYKPSLRFTVPYNYDCDEKKTEKEKRSNLCFFFTSKAFLSFSQIFEKNIIYIHSLLYSFIFEINCNIRDIICKTKETDSIIPVKWQEDLLIYRISYYLVIQDKISHCQCMAESCRSGGDRSLII